MGFVYGMKKKYFKVASVESAAAGNDVEGKYCQNNSKEESR